VQVSGNSIENLQGNVDIKTLIKIIKTPIILMILTRSSFDEDRVRTINVNS
jgi:hypothetical protein